MLFYRRAVIQEQLRHGRILTGEREVLSDELHPGRRDQSPTSKTKGTPVLRNCRVLSELVDADVPVWKPGDDLELTTHRLDITS